LFLLFPWEIHQALADEDRQQYSKATQPREEPIKKVSRLCKILRIS